MEILTPLAWFLSFQRKPPNFSDREDALKGRVSYRQETGSFHSERPLSTGIERGLHFSLGHRENHFCRGWYFRARFIKSDPSSPGRFLPFRHCRFYSLSQCGRVAIIAFDFFWQPTLNGLPEKSIPEFY